MNKYLSKYLFYYPSVFIRGEMVNKYLAEYRKFQWINEENLRYYQLSRIKKILKFAYTHTRYYREIYDMHGFHYNDIKSIDDFTRIPHISKSSIIEHHEAISSKWKYISGTKTTGGSTGQPVCIRKNPDALARERAATWRSYEWAGIEIGDPQARFWGVPHSRIGKSKAFLTDFIANRNRLSAFNLSESTLNSYYKKILKFKPSYLYGYVSVIKILSDYIKQLNLQPISSLKCIVTTSEILTRTIATEIQNVFGCGVFNEYGCGEVGSIAHQCENGNLHIMADNLYVEIDSRDDHAGELVVTDFFNLATPLIRYRLGDYALVSHEACSCGRGLPLIESIHGRAYDLIRTPGGKTIHPEAAIYVFESLQKKTNAFEQFQVVQKEVDKIIVRVVPSEKWNNKMIPFLIRHLKRNLDDKIEYNVAICDSIQREKSGKMRIVKNMIKY